MATEYRESQNPTFARTILEPFFSERQLLLDLMQQTYCLQDPLKTSTWLIMVPSCMARSEKPWKIDMGT